MFDDYQSFDLLHFCVLYSFLAPSPRLKILLLSLPFFITFFSSRKGNWISLSLCATCIFPAYPQLILSTNSEQCFLKLCSALPYGMVSVGIIIICELLAKWGKEIKKEFKS